MRHNLFSFFLLPAILATVISCGHQPAFEVKESSFIDSQRKSVLVVYDEEKKAGQTDMADCRKAEEAGKEMSPECLNQKNSKLLDDIVRQLKTKGWRVTVEKKTRDKILSIPDSNGNETYILYAWTGTTGYGILCGSKSCVINRFKPMYLVDLYTRAGGESILSASGIAKPDDFAQLFVNEVDNITRSPNQVK